MHRKSATREEIDVIVDQGEQKRARKSKKGLERARKGRKRVRAAGSQAQKWVGRAAARPGLCEGSSAAWATDRCMRRSRQPGLPSRSH